MPGNAITYPPGQRFGRLTVIERDPEYGRRGLVKWRCRCDCGITKSVTGVDLRAGTASCGCLVSEKARNRVVTRARTHGLSRKAPEFRIWGAMRQRCRNPRNAHYAYYGGRGITICPAWDEFAVFYADMGPRPTSKHSIDRINNDGPYSPENCRWATSFEQCQNQRNTRHLTYDGLTLTISEWAERLGVTREMLRARVKYGWTTERTLTQPPRQQ